MCSGLCQGRCEGTCEGGCDGDPNLPVPECAAGTQCRGECAGDYTSPVCHGPLTPNPCGLAAECAADCASVGALGVACEPATTWFMPRASLDATLKTALEEALAELVTVHEVEAPAIAQQAERIAAELQGTAASSGEPLRTAQALVRVRAAGEMLEAIASGTRSVVEAAGPPRDTPGPSLPGAECNAVSASGRDGLIDDFEDGNSQVLVRDGRNGVWHVFQDGSEGADISMTDPPVPDSGGANGSRRAMHLSGSGFQDWGAGVGLELRSGVLPYDASAHQGIRFWARGTPSLRLVFVQQDLATGDTCAACSGGSSECANFYGASAVLSDDWTEFTVPWSALSQSFAGSTAFGADQLLMIKFEAPPADRFEFWLDDVSFY
jgi:hypothetical protein